MLKKKWHNTRVRLADTLMEKNSINQIGGDVKKDVSEFIDGETLQ